jgi:DNA-binding beta-propeller fold protein YncE
VSQYDVDPVSGALTPKSPATVFAGPGASDVAVARDGRSAYVTLPLPFHRVDAAVAQFSIDPATGTLSPKNPPAVASGVSPVGVTTSPDGRSVYVANQLGASISQYDTDPLTGALAPKSPAEVPVGLTPLTVAVTPDGLNAYTPNAGFGSGTTVSQLSIDPATGALTPKTPAEVTAGNLPEDLAVAPDGGALYVANGLDNNVSQFAIGATGLLAPLAPATVPTGDAPTAVATTPPPSVPKTKDDCRNGGWRTFGPPPFKNQGDCVSFVATHGRNHPGG